MVVKNTVYIKIIGHFAKIGKDYILVKKYLYFAELIQDLK